MTITFTQSKVTLDDIGSMSEANRKRLEHAKNLINQAVTDLTSMGATYSSFVTEVTAAAAINPSDAAWQTAKAELDQMVTDFQALKSTAQSLKTAVEGV